MALINDVKAVLQRLAPRGWKDLFGVHGLDIAVNGGALAAELARDLIDDPCHRRLCLSISGKGLSPHRQHADLSFSRTGVARVGTEAARNDAASRSFDPRPANGDRGFAALPARYGVFIAEYRTPTCADQVAR